MEQDEKAQDTHVSSHEAQVDEDVRLDARIWATFSSLAVLSFTISLEATVLVPVLPSIAVALHGTTSGTLWAGSSYLLTAAVFQPLIGALSEEFGRQKLLLGSIALFTIGVLICSLSHHMPEFLAGRSIQGIGGGGILALVNIIPTAMVSLKQRPIAIIMNQVGYVAGTILGPVLGGIIGQYTTWRWVFYINFPLCGLVLPVVVFVMKLDDGSPPSFKEQMRRLDYIGAILFLASTCSFLIGIIWGGEQYPWSSWHTLLPIVCGIVGLVAALLWEAYGTSAPFLCLSLFSILSANAVYAGTFLQGFLLFCQLYYLPVYFEGVRGFSTGSTGLTFLPITGAMIVGSLGSGALIQKTTRLRWIVIIGWILATISTSLLFLLDMNTPLYIWVLIFLTIGIGHGMLIISLNYALQVLAKKHQAGHAMSMYTFLRASGMCIGIAAGSSLLQNALNSHLGSRTGSGSALMDITNLSAHPELPPALLVSFRYTCAVMTAVSGAGLLLSFIFAASSDIRK